MPSNNVIHCCPLLLLPSIFPIIRVFSNELVLCIRWPKYWSFSFNISPSNEHLGLISFRMDWLDLLAVQGTLKSLLQHHGSKASILWCSAFFIVQLSHPYMTTGKRWLKTQHSESRHTLLYVKQISNEDLLYSTGNWELPDVQAGFRKCTATRDQIANIRLIIEKAREFQKNIYFCFID